MPGLLTGIFEGDDQSGETTTTSSDSVATDSNLDLGLAVDVELASEMGGTYQNLDGSETTWSHEGSLGANLDTDALLSTDTLASSEDFASGS